MPTLVLVNPVAGRGRGRRAGRAVAQHAARHWRDVSLQETEAPGHAVHLVRSAAESGVARVIVVGGDGTVHEAANGILTAKRGGPPALGVVPVGTGNDFAGLLGTARLGVDEAVDRLAQAQERRFDVGRVGETFFVNAFGIGFDAAVAARVRPSRRVPGLLLYLLAVLRTLPGYRPIALTLRTDERSFTGPVFLLEAGNGVSTGGGFYLTPDARPDDGLLDLCRVQPLPLPGLLLRLPFAMFGRHTRFRHVTMERTTRLEIDTMEPLLAHLDGELHRYEPGTVTVEVVAGVLPVLVAE